MSSEGSSYAKLETTTLGFGVCTSIINAILFLFTIGEMIAFNTTPLPTMPPRLTYNLIRKNGMIEVEPHDTLILFKNIGFVLTILISGLHLTFCVMLCVGVTKRKPSYILAYFIYGIVMLVLLSSIKLWIMVELRKVTVSDIRFIIVMLVIYPGCLHVVYLTHQKIISG